MIANWDEECEERKREKLVGREAGEDKWPAVGTGSQRRIREWLADDRAGNISCHTERKCQPCVQVDEGREQELLSFL